MRNLKILVLGFLRVAGLFSLARAYTARSVRIICYHGAWLPQDGYPGDAMYISPRTFDRRMKILVDLGYPVISLEEAVAGLKGQRQLPAAPVVITIDDGWFSTYDKMLPVLARRNMPATLYCDTAHLMAGLPIAHMMARHLWAMAKPDARTTSAREAYDEATDLMQPLAHRMAGVRALADELGVDIQPYLDTRAFDYMTESELREAYAAGLDVQLHTHTHHMHDMSPEAIRRELDANRTALSEVIRCSQDKLKHFCYPSGITCVEAAKSLGRFGIESSTTTAPGLATTKSHMQLLPRFVDGEQVDDIEFEAELSGLMPVMRDIAVGLATVPQWLRSTIPAFSQRL